jgi:hypothetical protein
MAIPTMSFDVPAIKTLAFETIDGGEKWGSLTAIDLKAKGKILSQQRTEDSLDRQRLGDRGRASVYGEAKSDLSAFRCKTGKVCGLQLPCGRERTARELCRGRQTVCGGGRRRQLALGFRWCGAVVVFGLAD